MRTLFIVYYAALCVVCNAKCHACANRSRFEYSLKTLEHGTLAMRCESEGDYNEWTSVLKNMEDPKLSFHQASLLVPKKFIKDSDSPNKAARPKVLGGSSE